jgi:L-ribulose-5-phosphate 4-epimerase
MVVVDLEGNVAEGKWRPSSDTATHLALIGVIRRWRYRAYPLNTCYRLGTSRLAIRRWAPPMQTISSAIFPARERLLRRKWKAVRAQHRQVIIETLGEASRHTPGIVVYQHGPFAWGKDAHDAVHNAVVMEEVARMAWIARGFNPIRAADLPLMNNPFMPEAWPDAYYGQK